MTDLSGLVIEQKFPVLSNSLFLPDKSITMHLLPIAGLGLTALFIVLTAFRKRMNRSDRLLLILFLLLSAELLYSYLRQTGRDQEYIWIAGFDLVYWILFGPVIYCYARTILFPGNPWKWKEAIHLAPMLIVSIPFIHFLLHDDGHISFFSFAYSHNLAYRIIIFVFWEFCSLGYLIATIIFILRHRRGVQHFFSSVRKRNLNWLLFLSTGFSAYIIIGTTLMYLIDFRVIPDQPILASTHVIVLIVFILGIGVYGYRQEGIFGSFTLESISNISYSGKISVEPERVFKYRKSGLSDEERKALVADLNRIMRNDQPWLDCELSIQTLADKLNTSVHKLSQLINEQHHQNFYDYINSWRIQAVRKLLSDPANNDQKIMSLAYDCGFNSKSAFYTIFRKATGMTPSDFRLKNQAERALVFSN